MIFTNINKFHTFWLVFEFRNDIYKNELKWEESQADRLKPGWPAYPRGASSCNFVVHGSEHKNNPTQGCLMQKSQVETKRLEPS